MRRCGVPRHVGSHAGDSSDIATAHTRPRSRAGESGVEHTVMECRGGRRAGQVATRIERRVEAREASSRLRVVRDGLTA